MIKLYDLLLEIQGKPKAIFLAGGAGSGKSYISKKLIPSSFIHIDVDQWYEELLKQSGLGTKQKDFNSDQLSQAAKLQHQAVQLNQKDLEKWSNDKQNILIDGTGASSKSLITKKQNLEKLGYECLMLMIYVSPLTSLERNKQRERSILPSIVLQTWKDVNSNINTYKQEFGDHFILINNDPEGVNKNFSKELLEPYFKDSLAKGKGKTPEDEVKSKAKKEQLNKDIETLLQSQNKFDLMKTAEVKIKNFINGK